MSLARSSDSVSLDIDTSSSDKVSCTHYTSCMQPAATGETAVVASMHDRTAGSVCSTPTHLVEFLRGQGQPCLVERVPGGGPEDAHPYCEQRCIASIREESQRSMPIPQQAKTCQWRDLALHGRYFFPLARCFLFSIVENQQACILVLLLP